METDRRRFLETTREAISVGAAALALGGRVLGANDRVRVAVCGTRGRGKDHIRGFAKVAGAEIAALCDVDETILSQRLKDVEELGKPKPKSYVDIRKLLEDKDIDAISIATPNHWHSLMGIWACQAGKVVYVEKPCSHDPFEGRQLVRAVKKYNRICQHGSQSRSNPGMIEAIQRVRYTGKISIEGQGSFEADAAHSLAFFREALALVESIYNIHYQLNTVPSILRLTGRYARS